MEHDHMIETLATNGSNHSLYIGSLPRRTRCGQDFANAHISHSFSEVIAKDPIAVSQQVTRELVKGECLPQLLSRPLRGWMGGDIEVQNATSVMGQDQEHVKDLEADRGHREEVDGESAGINRSEVGDERALRERSNEPLGPEFGVVVVARLKRTILVSFFKAGSSRMQPWEE
jgi:hypothetical protein